jgi:hypothetical protein
LKSRSWGLTTTESKNCSRQRNIDGTLEQNEDSTSKNLSSDTANVLKNKQKNGRKQRSAQTLPQTDI